MKFKSLLLALSAAALIPALAQAKPDGDQPRGDRQGPPPAAKLFKQLDTDENGSISQQEAKGPLAEHFDHIDADSNGEITKEEFAKAQKKMRERGGDRIKEMDTDESGTISKSEAGERLLEHFDEIDADGDGEITKEEFKAAREKMGERRKGPRSDDEA